jgi:uncharacterized OB-fold protein
MDNVLAWKCPQCGAEFYNAPVPNKRCPACGHPREPQSDDRFKFSLSVRIDTVTPAHITVSIFSGMIPVEYAHHKAAGGRGLSGVLVLRVGEFEDFMDHIKPHLVRFPDDTVKARLALVTTWKPSLRQTPLELE